MNFIYYAIVTLSVFSDLLLKGYLPGSVALMVQYTLAVVILILIIRVNNKKIYYKPNSNFAFLITLFAFFLLFNYTIQMLVSFDVPIMHSATHMAYISIPLLFVLVVLWRCPDFDLIKLGNIFLLMMIPVNLVGIIQFFFDGNFLISHAYSESGGIVLRNSNQGIFTRYPSVFVSADRYSAIGLMQLYFAVVLLFRTTEKTFKLFFWVNFNLISGLVAILVSGARSRIFIILALMLLMALSLLIFKALRGMSQKTVNAVLVSFLVLLGAGIYFSMNSTKSESNIINFPVVDLLIDSIEEKRTQHRVMDYIVRSSLTDEVTMFGNGLGSIGRDGKPAEMGIMSIWIECGYIGGAPILLGYLGFISVLSYLALLAFIRGKPLGICIYGLPALALVTGCLTGLTSVFELSSSILLMTAIGASMPKNRRRIISPA